MTQNFVVEIEHLLQQVPSAIWADHSVCGLMFDFIPWHGHSGISIQTRADDQYDPASWKYFNSIEAKCSQLSREVALYRQAADRRLTYHRLLTEAAEALLNIDFARYGQRQTRSEYRLYGPFRLQVTDPDGTFEFNYCEYVLARRLDNGQRVG